MTTLGRDVGLATLLYLVQARERSLDGLTHLLSQLVADPHGPAAARDRD